MNERIKNLLMEARLFCYDNGTVSLLGETYAGQAEVQRFAELIIAKCIEEAGDPADGLIKDDTWHDGVRASVWSIQQYFGVKE